MNRPTNLLEALKASLATSARHAPGEVSPTAILWPDADGQWKPLLGKLRGLMPNLLVLGEYSPTEKQGPSIWLRCAIARVLPDVQIPEGAVPVIYLPGISRQTLRAAEDCPDALKPLIELQFRGTVWCQRNGRDWTVEAFLVSDEGGLELDVSRETKCHQAMLGALHELAGIPLARLRGKRLETEDFDRLVIEDTPRNLLEWMNDPGEVRAKWDEARWNAFRNRCQSEYGFDPQFDGELAAGERLGLREGVWAAIWDRFAEAPALYPGLPDLLSRAKPAAPGLFAEKGAWPVENEDAEKQLRKDLLSLRDQNPAAAREKVLSLEKEHAGRREWVWAKLGSSPLAEALGHLSRLASHTQQALGGDTPKAMGDRYAHEGYLADDALLRALASIKSAQDSEAVSVAAQAMYLPWAQDAAEHLQRLIAANPLPGHGAAGYEPVVAPVGVCVLFVDGLRYDIGKRLVALAEERSVRVAIRTRWAALPSVTATAKPAVSPISDKLVGHRLPEDFSPDVAATTQSLNHDRFKRLLADSGFQALATSESGDPLAARAGAWTEYGDIDKLGHELQVKLPAHIDDQLDLLIERIRRLLTAGWKQVRVVTDHGWILTPLGLPTVALPKHLVESRWSRCATIKQGAAVDVPVAGWHWNPSETFAFGPGVKCFGKGNFYAHGGVSLQECLIPDISFTADEAQPTMLAMISDVSWLGLRCRVSIQPAGLKGSLDIRTKAGDSASSISASKPVDAEGKAGLLVENEALIGTAATVVLLDTAGRVIAKKATVVGGEE